MKILFETERLLVRQLVDEDADNFFLLNSNEEVMRFIRAVKNRKECDDFLKENMLLYKEGSVIGRYTVIEKVSGSYIGNFSLLYLSIKDGFHLGFALLPAFWGKGFAQELIKAGTDYFFSATNKNELFAITQPENSASQKALLKSRFIAKGTIVENKRLVELFQIDKEGY